ncbi:MAG: type II secretion system F family protein [Planctomycetales bacterium]|nr:type II secretion system F family protein [Planctomycetales bacterium]
MMALKALGMFCRRMGTGLRSGVDILRLLENETRLQNQSHRQAMQRVLESVRSGSTLAKAMVQENRHFPPLLIQLVHASELGGSMDRMFEYMANYYEQLRQTRSYFVQKITMPVVQLVLAVGIIGLVILIQGILSPNSTYNASGTGLSGVRGFVIYMSYVGSVFGTLGLLAWGIWKNWFNCHQWLMPLVQRIPMLGTALTTLGLSRLSMSLSMLLNAGVEAKRSLKQAFLSTGNHYFISGMPRALASVESGQSFGDAFLASRVLPNEFVEMVQIGELSGTETESLDHLATEYQTRAKDALTNIATIVSTVIWLSVILIIGAYIIRLGLQYISMLNSFL